MIPKIFKYLSLVLVSLCMISCGDDNEEPDFIPPTPPSPGEGLTLTLSRQVIQANGTDKTDFIVKYDGLPITDDVTIYNDKDEEITNSKNFSTTQAGEYKFWAAYKSMHTDLVTLKAISVPVPELPVDNEPARTDFTKRVMLTQFTGTGCQFCPYMTTCVKEALSNEEYADKAVLCVAHTFNRNDPGYLTDDRLAQAFGISSYPSINIDFIKSFNYNRNFTSASICSIIDQAYEYPANAGISAKAEITEGNDGNKTLALHVAVKAAQDGEYSVGAWLMEDSIKARQATDGNISGNFDTHNHTLRVVDSKAEHNNYSGIKLGKIAKGKTAEHVFVISIKDKWVLENCHLAIFVSERKDNRYQLTNVVPCPVEGELNYDYKKQ